LPPDVRKRLCPSVRDAFLFLGYALCFGIKQKEGTGVWKDPVRGHGSPQFNGLLLVVGFVALLILLVLSD
jgi:hypothetical protein